MIEKDFELLTCYKCGMSYCSDEKHRCDKYPHHGNTNRRIKAFDCGTDYFSFECPVCKCRLSVTKLRQCRGGGDEGRLIINLKCIKCGLVDARKLWFGTDKIILVEQCKHKGFIT